MAFARWFQAAMLAMLATACTRNVAQKSAVVDVAEQTIEHLLSPDFQKDRSPLTPLLYAVNCDGHRGYLFGSIHFGEPSWYPLPNYVEGAFRASKSLYLELELTQETGNKMADEMAAARYKDPDSLEKHISPAAFKALSDTWFFKSPIESTKRLPPWQIVLEIEQNATKRAHLSALYGIDFHFVREANGANKSIVAIEKIEDQLDAFRNLTPDEQSHMLIEELEDAPFAAFRLRELAHAWKTGDAHALEAFMLEEFSDPESAHLQELLLFARNRHMLATVKAAIDADKMPFVVVGAAHIIGPKGIAEGLRKAQCEVDAQRGDLERTKAK